MSDTIPGPKEQCPYCTAYISVVRTALPGGACPLCEEPVSWLLDSSSGPKQPAKYYVVVTPTEDEVTTVFGPYANKTMAQDVFVHFRWEDAHEVRLAQAAPPSGAVWTTESSVDIAPFSADREIDIGPIEIKEDIELNSEQDPTEDSDGNEL
jgi:hypothetical protein